MVEVLKHGSYVIIDPAQLGLVIQDCPPDQGKFMTINNEKIFVFNTRYGAGTFPVKVCGKDHGSVDSDYGMIAVMPKHVARDLDPAYFDFLMVNFYKFVINEIEFDMYVIPTCQNGVLRFGNAVEINTLVAPNIGIAQDQRVERNMSMYLIAHMMFKGIA
jgi:hypothetical protein